MYAIECHDPGSSEYLSNARFDSEERAAEAIRLIERRGCCHGPHRVVETELQRGVEGIPA